MCNRCNWLQNRPEIIGVDHHTSDDPWRECLRPEDHEGPHLILDTYGKYKVWEYDSECDCEYCKSEDPLDHCLVFGTVTKKEANKLIRSAEYDL